MVRNPVGHLQPEELPERKRIRAAPLDPALAVDPLEIPDHVHAEVPARRHRGCAHGLGVERSAGVLHESVEPGSEQHLLQAVVEHVAGRARHLGPHHHQLALTIALPTHRHSQTPVQSPSTIDSDQPDFVNGLLSVEQPIAGTELRAIKRYLATRSDGLPWLFISERGQPLTRQSVNYLVSAAAERAGLGPVHPHMLRHACGFYLANQGYDLRLIQDYLGHRDPKHTVHYTRVAGSRFEGLWR